MWSSFLGCSICFLLILLAAFKFGCSVKIRQLRVPAALENGSVPAAILDCDYTYESGDTFSLVVKWFLNSGSQPVYQWIPPQPPQALGVLANRLDLDYRASEDNYTMHRALKIISPTVELSGEYKCHVSSFDTEDHWRNTFIIYAPAKSMSVQQTKPSEDTVNISCHALGLYPKPTAEMGIYKGRKKNRGVVSDTTLVVSNSDGLYDVTLYKVFEDKKLSAETVFECVFSILGTSYSRKDMLTYHPGLNNVVKPTSHVKSLVLSTEPSLIGIPTVMGNNSVHLKIQPSIQVLLVLLTTTMTTLFMSSYLNSE